MTQNIEDLVIRVQNKNNSDDEWLQLEKDMHEFLKENHPEEEKRQLSPFYQNWRKHWTAQRQTYPDLTQSS